MDEIWLTGNESQLTKLEVFNIRTLGSLKRTPQNRKNYVISLHISILNRLMVVDGLKNIIIVMCNWKCIFCLFMFSTTTLIYTSVSKNIKWTISKENYIISPTIPAYRYTRVNRQRYNTGCTVQIVPWSRIITGARFSLGQFYNKKQTLL